MMGIALIFNIPGQIGGKGRHRSTIRAGKISNYTPAKTRSDEAIVRHYAAQAMRNFRLLEGALRIEIAVRRRHPQSWSKKRKAATSWITGKPDWDNLGKMVCDAMNGIVYGDDAQIADGRLSKKYIAPEDADKDHVRILIETLEDGA